MNIKYNILGESQRGALHVIGVERVTKCHCRNEKYLSRYGWFCPQDPFCEKDGSFMCVNSFFFLHNNWNDLCLKMLIKIDHVHKVFLLSTFLERHFQD